MIQYFLVAINLVRQKQKLSANFQLDLTFVIQIISCTNLKRAMSDHDMNSTLHIPNLICTTYSTSCCSTYKQLSFALNWWMLKMLIDI